VPIAYLTSAIGFLCGPGGSVNLEGEDFWTRMRLGCLTSL